MLLKKHESNYIKENTVGDLRFYSGPFGGDIQIFAGALKWEIWMFNQTEYINYIEPPQRDMKFDQEAKRVQRWKIWPLGEGKWVINEKEGVVQQKRMYAAAKEDMILT